MKIKIGARTYTIEEKNETNDSTLEKNEEAFGYTEYPSSRIVIRDNVESDFKKEQIVHEMLHAICDNAGLEVILDQKNLVEKLVTILTPRLHDAIKNNKELFIFLAE